MNKPFVTFILATHNRRDVGLDTVDHVFTGGRMKCSALPNVFIGCGVGLRAAEVYDAPDPINNGTGREITIRELATLIAELTGFDGGIEWDPSQPDGQPRRRLDTTRAAHFLNWQPGVDLRTGSRRTIDWWSANAPCNAPGLSPVSHIP